MDLSINDTNLLTYNEIKNNIRPFDAIFLRGDNIINEMINIVDKYKLTSVYNVGIVVTADVLPYCNINYCPKNRYLPSNMKDEPFHLDSNKLYILKSTSDFNLADKGTFGVQLRELADNNDKTKVAWCKLLINPYNKIGDETDDELNFRREKLKINFMNFFGTMYPTLHTDINDKTYKDITQPFSSELILSVYQMLNVIPQSFKDLLPNDFLTYDKLIIDKPIYIKDWLY